MVQPCMLRKRSTLLRLLDKKMTLLYNDAMPVRAGGTRGQGGYLLDAVTSSGILKAKQKLGVTFNFDKEDVFDFTKFSKMAMRRASEANSEK